ncbi:MAG: hypothetical protein ABII80_02285 [bacterium]
MNSQKITNLRNKYPVFEYKSSSWEKRENILSISWTMVAGDLSFHPTLTLNLAPNLSSLDNKLIDELVFQLGLAEIPSYWKATCSPTILISAGHLSTPQITWWHDLYLKGMGEYFYQNQIDFTEPNFLTIQAKQPEKDITPVSGNSNSQKPLILVSDGKDTATTLALLSQAHVTFDTLSIKRNSSLSPLLSQFQIQHNSQGNRIIDPTLLQLNKDEYLNGHVPLSAYLAFTGVLTAYLQGNNHVIVSNEASSNEGNVVWNDISINHQYSKSFEFEEKLAIYLHDYLNLGITYFSFLRPLYELQIAGLLTRFSSLLPIFSSCNATQAKGETGWCGSCPKCLSTYLMLMPFLGQTQTSAIFGKDALADASLLETYRSLLGKTNHKPFECVSTFEEIILASYLSLSKYSSTSLPTLLKYFQTSVLPEQKDLSGRTSALLSHFGNNLLKAPYLSILQQTLPIEVK